MRRAEVGLAEHERRGQCRCRTARRPSRVACRAAAAGRSGRPASVTVRMTSASSDGWKRTNGSSSQRREPRVTGPSAKTVAIDTTTKRVQRPLPAPEALVVDQRQGRRRRPGRRRRRRSGSERSRSGDRGSSGVWRSRSSSRRRPRARPPRGARCSRGGAGRSAGPCGSVAVDGTGHLTALHVEQRVVDHAGGRGGDRAAVAALLDHDDDDVLGDRRPARSCSTRRSRPDRRPARCPSCRRQAPGTRRRSGYDVPIGVEAASRSAFCSTVDRLRRRRRACAGAGRAAAARACRDESTILTPRWGVTMEPPLAIAA